MIFVLFFLTIESVGKEEEEIREENYFKQHKYETIWMEKGNSLNTGLEESIIVGIFYFLYNIFLGKIVQWSKTAKRKETRPPISSKMNLKK